MFAVFKATDKKTQNIVALKIIGKRSRSTRELKNFRKEVTIQKNLCHPNIILLLDSFETSCEIVVVTELWFVLNILYVKHVRR